MENENENENVTVETTTSEQNVYVADTRPEKSKLAAGLLHILLGDIGIGNFYMGKIGLGIIDILFCWTAIPGIVNLIRGIIVLCQSNEAFEQKYNVRASK